MCVYTHVTMTQIKNTWKFLDIQDDGLLLKGLLSFTLEYLLQFQNISHTTMLFVAVL